MEINPTRISKQKILSLLRDNQLQQAKELCESLHQTSDNDVQVWAFLGSACLQLGEFKDAEAASRRALTLDSEAMDARSILAQALSCQGRVAEAISVLKQIIQARPESADAHVQLAAACYQAHDARSAESHCRQAVAFSPEHFTANTMLGNLLLEKGDLITALDYYENALRIRPDANEVIARKGDVLMGMGRFDEARMAYKTVIVNQPESAIVHHNLGEACQNLGRLEEAITSYREAIRLMPDRVEPYVNLGRVYQKQNKLIDAVALHRKALEIDPHSSVAHHNIGLCVYDDTHQEKAAQAFREAIDCDPGNALALCFYGIILESIQGNEDEAREYYQSAIALSSLAGCIIESYHYAKSAGPKARFFSTTAQVLQYAVREATVDGMFLEFGVYRGESITTIAGYADETIHGFDSFQGLTEGWYTGKTEHQSYEGPGTYSTDGELPDVPDTVKLHVGTFEETLPGFIEKYMEPVSFINIDCDLYSSTITIFRYLASRIKEGTIIVFDEYLCYPEWRQHEYKAFQEFILDNHFEYEYIAFNYFTGQAVIRILGQIDAH